MQNTDPSQLLGLGPARAPAAASPRHGPPPHRLVRQSRRALLVHRPLGRRGGGTGARAGMTVHFYLWGDVGFVSVDLSERNVFCLFLAVGTKCNLLNYNNLLEFYLCLWTSNSLFEMKWINHSQNIFNPQLASWIPKIITRKCKLVSKEIHIFFCVEITFGPQEVSINF